MTYLKQAATTIAQQIISKPDVLDTIEFCGKTTKRQFSCQNFTPAAHFQSSSNINLNTKSDVFDL